MREIRELLRLKYEPGRGHREIALSPGVANSTVGDCADRAGAVGLSWPLRGWTTRRRPARRALGHGTVAQPDVLLGPVVDLPTSLRALPRSASSAESGDWPLSPSKSVFDKLAPKPDAPPSPLRQRIAPCVVRLSRGPRPRRFQGVGSVRLPSERSACPVCRPQSGGPTLHSTAGIMEEPGS